MVANVKLLRDIDGLVIVRIKQGQIIHNSDNVVRREFRIFYNGDFG